MKKTLMEMIIRVCNAEKKACLVRRESLEIEFNCKIPTHVVHKKIGDFRISWTTISYIPQEINKFCEENNIEISVNSLNEDIHFAPVKLL